MAVRSQVASAINLVVCCERLHDGTRQLTHISEVLPLDERGDYRTQDLFVFTPVARGEEDEILGYHAPTGIVPHFVHRARALGFHDSTDAFFDPATYGLPPPPTVHLGQSVHTRWAPSLKHRERGLPEFGGHGHRVAGVRGPAARAACGTARTAGPEAARGVVAGARPTGTATRRQPRCPPDGRCPPGGPFCDPASRAARGRRRPDASPHAQSAAASAASASGSTGPRAERGDRPGAPRRAGGIIRPPVPRPRVRPVAHAAAEPGVHARRREHRAPPRSPATCGAEAVTARLREPCSGGALARFVIRSGARPSAEQLEGCDDKGLETDGALEPDVPQHPRQGSKNHPSGAGRNGLEWEMVDRVTKAYIWRGVRSPCGRR